MQYTQAICLLADLRMLAISAVRKEKKCIFKDTCGSETVVYCFIHVVTKRKGPHNQLFHQSLYLIYLISSNVTTGKVTQVVYGHWDMCTCLARSECPVGGDCYVVSGSKDATLLVWHWSAKLQWVLGENHVHGKMGYDHL